MRENELQESINRLNQEIEEKEQTHETCVNEWQAELEDERTMHEE